MSNTAPTRTAAFEARLRKRYAAERRFKLLGLAAVLFSVAVLAFLLVTMTFNGIGGFQRTELAVTIDFRQAALNLDPALQTESQKIQALETQGLPAVVEFYGEKSLGEDGARSIERRSLAHCRLGRHRRPVVAATARRNSGCRRATISPTPMRATARSICSLSHASSPAKASWKTASTSGS